MERNHERRLRSRLRNQTNIRERKEISSLFFIRVKIKKGQKIYEIQHQWD